MSDSMVAQVFELGCSVVQRIQETQSQHIVDAAKAVASCYLHGHSFFVSGSGHSHTLTEEFYARAGGLAFVKPILTTELTLTEHPTKSSYIERLDGYAAILADLYRIEAEERRAYREQLRPQCVSGGARPGVKEAGSDGDRHHVHDALPGDDAAE